ncbi:ATP-binding protein [Candidatus Micrarchaeota archaeon]|nr:ATP-binding protein [Candidatus Micrarchaeota archaeon]
MDRKAVEELRLISLSLLKTVVNLKERYIVKKLEDNVYKKPRIKLLKGFRGVGKTTALLQLFGKTADKWFYFSADHPIAKEAGIYTTVKEIVLMGYFNVLIDEIHTYPAWKSEIKALHDEFSNLTVIASGSAPLAFLPERREELIELKPLDLGEYIFLKKSEIIESGEEWQEKGATIKFIASQNSIQQEFNKYLVSGGFPSSLELEEEKALNAIYNSIRKSVREDGVFFLSMSKEKIFGMENLLTYLATSPLGDLNITSLSKSLALSKTVIYEILSALEGMEIIRVIKPYKKGMALVRAEPKILFSHPNLRYAICKQLGKNAEIGAVREELAVFGFAARGWRAFTIKGIKKSPDYVVEKGDKILVVEIGGPSKNKSQLKGFEKGLVIDELQLIPLLVVAKSSKTA